METPKFDVLHAEPGDLLVKAARGETWTFTVQGWRELSPIELQRADETDDDRMEATGGGYCSAHGVFQGMSGCPGCAAGDPPRQPQPRFFGRSVIEDEVARIKAQGVGYTPESATLPQPWKPDERQQEILNELDNAAERVRDAVVVLDGLPRTVAEQLDLDLGDVELYVAGIRYARLLAERWMRNLYGPQGVA